MAKPTLYYGDLLGYYHLTGHADEDADDEDDFDAGDGDIDDADADDDDDKDGGSTVKMRKTDRICENLWRD